MAPIGLGLGLGLTKGGGGAAGPAGPIYDMNFAAGVAMNPAFTFTRTTTAWRRNSSGLWESVASGVLRYHHTEAGEPLGILIEETRTDRALWNRDLTNTVWTKTDVTAAKDTTGIDGAANSASSLTATAASGMCLQGPIAHTSSARTFHPWIRRKTGTGTVEITLDNISWTDVTSLINSSTWSQVSIGATLANPTVGFKLGTSGDAIEVDFAGVTDGTAQSTNFATSPILTTTAVVTRNVDGIIGSPSPRPEYSIVIKAVSPNLTYGLDRHLWYDSVDGTNEAHFKRTATTGTISWLGEAASAQWTINSTAPGLGATFKAGVRFKENDAAIVVNGGSVSKDTSCSIPSSVSTKIGYGPTASVWNSTIAHLRLWGRALSDAELQAETTP